MIYLSRFRLPLDDWTDWYFSPIDKDYWKFVSARIADLIVTLKKRFPNGIPQVSPMTGFTSWYPWKVFYQRGNVDFFFSDLTILYGGNGSGKSTLLNVIAQKLELHRSTLYNRSAFFDDYLKYCDSFLEECRDSRLAIQKGKIITSDDVFDNMLKTRSENQTIDFERECLVKEFIKNPVRKKKETCSKYVRSHLPQNCVERSNGETAFNYFVEEIQDKSLILLDEPENSLSAQWQIELAQFLQGAVCAFNCQLIIATHSPFILSIPGACIYDLDVQPIQKSKWQNLENIRCYYELFKQHEDLFSDSWS